MRPLALAAAIAGLFAANASATVLFSTVGQPNNSPNPVYDTDYRLASGFKTGMDDAEVTDITLWMNNSDSIAHNFRVALYDDNGGTPGSWLTNFSTALVAANQFTAVDKLFNHAGFSVVADTIYWVVLEMLEAVSNPGAGNDPAWSGNTSGGIDSGNSFLSLAPIVAQYSNDAGTSWNDSSTHNFLFKIEGTLTPVPEPSRAVLAIAGLFVLGFRRRR